MEDYFDESLKYKNPKTFRRRFQMSKRLLLHITEDLEREFNYFKQKVDGQGTLGFTTIQKVTSAICVFTYGNTTDINGENLKMADKATQDTLEYFCYGIIKMNASHYLRTPNCNDLEQIYEAHAKVHGLPHTTGSIDYLVQHAWMFRRLPGENEVEDEGKDEDKNEFDDEMRTTITVVLMKTRTREPMLLDADWTLAEAA
ncbi:uncharacterized protein LOC143613243 [Bidens hawaiensis]|uniref:uncharacterized protein LOC143613243 n=1 Tax=Bidens hawaiensis TaxID=980011 RepID=UPI00404AD5CF